MTEVVVVNALNLTSPTSITANITSAWNTTITAIQKAFRFYPLKNGKTLLNTTKDESDA